MPVASPHRVRVVAGPDIGTNAELASGGLTVGRDGHADLVLTDPRVARFHLDITAVDGGLRVTDLDSPHGTFHGATRIGRVTFDAEVTVRVGDTELLLTPRSAHARIDTTVRFGAAVAASRAMHELFATLEEVADRDLSVLLEGESGTGKEVLAEALHARSRRHARPFVVVDCASLPRTLIGAELFGYARGAFTNAVADKPGLFEVANGGTLFIDEVGELPLELQPHLLRALDKGEVRRIGELTPRRVDVRVIAATHRSLPQMMSEERFRSDLFFRLAVVRARVPPLRERKEDIPQLVRAFVGELGADAARLPPDLLDRLVAHDWPGNVRELRHAVARAVWLGDPFPVVPDVAPRPLRGDDMLARPFKEAKGLLLEAFERRYLASLLLRHGGNLTHAARASGIERNNLRRMALKRDVEYVRA